MTWTEVKELAALIGAAIAILTFIKSTFEYVLQGAQKRAERFLAVRKVFKDNPKFRDICDYVDRDDPVLATLPLQDRRDFAGFLEEVAILTNSHIVSEEVSLHFFGYYAIDCWNSQNFWLGLPKNTEYWSVLRDYVQQMRTMQAQLRHEPRKLRM